MANTSYSIGFIFILAEFIFTAYRSSAWFRLTEKKYVEHYQKSTRLFKFLKIEDSIEKFKRVEKFQFFFSLFLILLMILSTFIQ